MSDRSWCGINIAERDEVHDQGGTMNAKHTPGPWGIGGSLISGPSGMHIAYAIHRPSDRRLLANPPADCSRFGPQLAEADANARLIAAAPELLEALRNLLEWMEACGQTRVSMRAGVLTPGQGQRVGEEYTDVRAARAAIDKAEGR